MKKLRLLAVLLAAAGAAACTTEEERSVEWYQANPEARQAKLVECAEQAELSSSVDGNCARAQRAATLRRPVESVRLPSVTGD